MLNSVRYTIRYKYLNDTWVHYVDQFQLVIFINFKDVKTPIDPNNQPLRVEVEQLNFELVGYFVSGESIAILAWRGWFPDDYWAFEQTFNKTGAPTGSVHI